MNATSFFNRLWWTPTNGKAGTPNGSRPSWLASINYCRVFLSGTPRSTKSSLRRQFDRFN